MQIYDILMLLLKLLGLLFGLIYLLFAVLQYNDPDPAVWMLVYGTAALACFMAAANKITPALLWLAATLYAISAIFVWPEHFEGVQIGGGNIQNIEEAREALGLLLCTLSFICLALFKKNYDHGSSSAQHL